MSGDSFLKPLTWQTYPDDGRTSHLKPGQGAVRYNLILTGIPVDLKEVIRLANIPGLVEAPGGTIPLGSLITPHLLKLVPALKTFEDLEIRLYNLAVNTTEKMVWETIQKIYSVAAENGRVVFADPNLITVAPSSTGGGSGGAVGGPLDPLGRPGTEAEFIRHWAFGPDGIHLEDGKSARLTLDTTGKGVPVFVFDSCDRRIANEMNLTDQQDESTALHHPELRRNYPDRHLKLTISSPAGRFHRDQDLRRPVRILASNDPAKDVDEHGLFVAGIIHRVAPESSIHLVDVLNREGRGEIFGLLKALWMLAERAVNGAVNNPENGGHPPLEGVVVNLSLGTTLSEHFVEKNIYGKLKDLRQGAYGSQPGSHLMLSLLDDMVNHNHYVGSLRLIIKLLYELGAVIVAASGNDSAKVAGERLKQIPASYPEVIAVAASTAEKTKANFSNLGDIMAPGGGRDKPDIENDHFKYEAASDDEEYIKFSVMSLVPKLHTDSDGFAYWRGTSFSAPFVSGLAALMIEKLKAHNLSLHPSYIRALILQYARGGIINVQTILGQIK